MQAAGIVARKVQAEPLERQNPVNHRASPYHHQLIARALIEDAERHMAGVVASHANRPIARHRIGHAIDDRQLDNHDGVAIANGARVVANGGLDVIGIGRTALARHRVNDLA